MPLGIISNDDFQSELDRFNSNSIKKQVEVIEKDQAGKKDGDINVPIEIQKVIAEETLLSHGKRDEIASAFGVSNRTVTAYALGKNGHSDKQDKPELKQHISNARFKIARKSSNLAIRALNLITDERLDSLDAKDLSSIAKDAASTFKAMTEHGNEGNKQQILVQVYRPRAKDEDDYEVIDLNES